MVPWIQYKSQPGETRVLLIPDLPSQRANHLHANGSTSNGRRADSTLHFSILIPP